MTDPDETLIRPTAARFAGRYRMVEREDIAQELRLWWLQHERTVTRFIDAGETGKLARALQRAAEKYCRQIRAQVLGYSPDDEFFYSAGQLRELLPMIWQPMDVIQDSQPDEGGRVKSGKPANEGNNLLAMVSDIARAFPQLDLDYKYLLELHFYYGASNEEMAEQYGTSVPAIKMRVQRALDALVQVLGGKTPYESHEGPGSRRAISNAHAQAITHNQEVGA